VSAQPLTEMSTRSKGGRCVRLTTYHHPVPLSRNMGTLTFWNPLGHSKSITGLLYLYLLVTKLEQRLCLRRFSIVLSLHLHLSKRPYHDLFSNMVTVSFRNLLAVCLLLHDFILRSSDKT